jgi:hypothetical protein
LAAGGSAGQQQHGLACAGAPALPGMQPALLGSWLTPSPPADVVVLQQEVLLLRQEVRPLPLS